MLSPDAHYGSLKARFIPEFPILPCIEGIATADDGRFFYVTDEDDGVHLWLIRLISS